MPFGRLHEEAAGDSKLLALSDAAWRMWGMGLIYCQKNLTDGFIDGPAIETWGIKASNRQRVADELCREQVKGRAPLWTRAEGGYTVHDYLQWNDSKVEILAGRAKAKNRLQRFRQRCVTNGAQNADRNAFQNGEPHALPVVRGSSDLEERDDRARASESLEERAGRLREELYPQWFTKYREGARLRISLVANSLEFQDALSLVRTWDDARLEKLARIVLTTNDAFIAGTDRGFKIFALKASWADDRLRQAEQGKAS